MITADTIDDVWDRLGQMEAEQAQALAEQMEDEQPELAGYLYGLEGPEFDEAEAEALYFVGMVLWQIFDQAGQANGGLPPVTREALRQAEAANDSLVQQLGSDTSADMASATLRLLETYPEPEVLGSIIEVLNEAEDDADETAIRDENRGLAFFHLKTVLDALIGARETG